LATWTYRPPIVVTDIRAGGRSLPAGRFNRTGNIAPLIVGPGSNSFAVEFSALDFSAPERSRYAYQLEGFDKDWIQTDSTRRLAAYTNLPPGDYRLRLRGSNRVGVWTEADLDMPVRVLPDWYQTLWFKCAVVFAAGVAFLVLLQVRTLALRRRQRELEQQVLARTTELLHTQRQLEQIAYLDSLTSLPNRRMFNEAFRQQIAAASREQQRFALLLLDLDGLKKINDTLGHGFGDALLVEAAVRLKACVRDIDLVARLGGDEFAILLADVVDWDGIEHICRRIVDAFDTAFLHQGRAMSAGVSIGVALYPTHAASQDGLFTAADSSLYVAKRAGGGQWVWHKDEPKTG
jgi:diguanylate cyclase (GGDEF)-like protein